MLVLMTAREIFSKNREGKQSYFHEHVFK